MTLRDYLTRHNITPAAFAGALHVSLPTLYRYLSSDRFPGPENLRRIRDLTNGAVTADDFVDQHTASQERVA